MSENFVDNINEKFLEDIKKSLEQDSKEIIYSIENEKLTFFEKILKLIGLI